MGPRYGARVVAPDGQGGQKDRKQFPEQGGVRVGFGGVFHPVFFARQHSFPPTNTAADLSQALRQGPTWVPASLVLSTMAHHHRPLRQFLKTVVTLRSGRIIRWLVTKWLNGREPNSVSGTHLPGQPYFLCEQGYLTVWPKGAAYIFSLDVKIEKGMGQVFSGRCSTSFCGHSLVSPHGAP